MGQQIQMTVVSQFPLYNKLTEAVGKDRNSRKQRLQSPRVRAHKTPTCSNFKMILKQKVQKGDSPSNIIWSQKKIFTIWTADLQYRKHVHGDQGRLRLHHLLPHRHLPHNWWIDVQAATTDAGWKLRSLQCYNATARYNSRWAHNCVLSYPWAYVIDKSWRDVVVTERSGSSTNERKDPQRNLVLSRFTRFLKGFRRALNESHPAFCTDQHKCEQTSGVDIDGERVVYFCVLVEVGEQWALLNIDGMSVDTLYTNFQNPSRYCGTSGSGTPWWTILQTPRSFFSSFLCLPFFCRPLSHNCLSGQWTCGFLAMMINSQAPLEYSWASSSKFLSTCVNDTKNTISDGLVKL